MKSCAQSTHNLFHFIKTSSDTAIEHDSGEKKTTHANKALNHCAQLSYFTNRGQQLESF